MDSTVHRGCKESATTDQLSLSLSSILAGKIPRTEESGGLQSMGSQRAGHD